MVTWHPILRVTNNNEIVNDECEAAVKILPLRCSLDQKAIRFAAAFFRGEEDDQKDQGLASGRYSFQPPLFRSFRVKPCRLKVDYRPEKLDTKALRDGALVELINLSPINGMILTLQQVEATNVIGFGGVIPLVVRNWIQDICSTQIFKFVTNSRPLTPISRLGTGVTDLVVLPWEAIKNGEDIQKALRAGGSNFASTVMYEAVNLTSQAARFVADTVLWSTGNGWRNMLPSRPILSPRGLVDTTPHILETLNRGFQTANYKIIIVPYREYHRTGTRGAVTSVLKGIPVAIAAPTSATAEAISFALLGAGNELRPDIRQEEEAKQRGLQLDYC
jgi:autophagy-related protein 2